MSGTYDGSIRINTKIDTSGVEKGLDKVSAKTKEKTKEQSNAHQQVSSSIKQQETALSKLKQEYSETFNFAKLSTNEQRSLAQTLSGEYRKQGLNQSEAQKKAWYDLKNNKVAAEDLERAYKEITQQVNKYETASKKSGNTAKNAVDKVTATLKQMGTYLMAYLSVTAFLNFSNEASKMASSTEASVQRLVDIYGEASHAVGDFIDSGARALGMSKSAATSYAAVYGNLFSVWADQETNADLTNHYLNMTAVVASKTGLEVSDVQERIRSGLLGNTEAIEDLGIFVNIKTIEMTDAFKRMADGKSWEQLDAYSQQQIRTMAILEQATKKYGTEVAETSVLTRNQFLAAYEDFKTTWGQVVNTVLIPLLEIGTMVLNVLTKGLQVIAKISGKTIDTTVSQSNAISNAVDNQNALTDAVKETEKAQKGALAGFDEINTLSQETADNSSNGASGGINLGAIDLGTSNSTSTSNENVVSEVNETVTSIMVVVGAALIAIGIVLICVGQISWGIPFIIAGATAFVTGEAALKENEESQKVRDELNTIIAIVSVALLAIGIILVCAGATLPLGIGLIIAGCAGIAAEVALNWDTIKEKIDTILNNEKITKSILVIGIILLACPPFLPLAIGLIAVGATSLAKSQNLSWDNIKNKIKKVFTEIGDWLKIVGTLVLGVMLCVTGVGLPLGIPLILSGVGHLVDKVTIYWNTYGDKIKEVFNKIFNWIKTWGLLVLGIILCISGVAFPIGLALIAKGAANLTEEQDPMWLAIVDKIKEVWKKIQAYYKEHIAKYLTAEWWGQLAKDAISGFIKWVIEGINKLIAKINSFGFELPDILGGGTIGFNIPKLNIPRLATGMVIPPNQEFLAVLGDQKRGTNIEAPLDTIKQAVAEVIAQVNMNNNNGSKVTITVPVYLNGREILRAEREAENEMGAQTVFGGFAHAY